MNKASGKRRYACLPARTDFPRNGDPMTTLFSKSVQVGATGRQVEVTVNLRGTACRGGPGEGERRQLPPLPSK